MTQCREIGVERGQKGLMNTKRKFPPVKILHSYSNTADFILFILFFNKYIKFNSGSFDKKVFVIFRAGSDIWPSVEFFFIEIYYRSTTVKN